MGLYIDPPTGTKEEWIEKHKQAEIYRPEACAGQQPTGCLLVVLVDNGIFTAAGIAYNEDERKSWFDPMDMRPTRYFWVSVKDLLEVCPQLESRLQKT